jgi:hypothetical protein
VSHRGRRYVCRRARRIGCLFLLLRLIAVAGIAVAGIIALWG